eukprot:TRINITY_DN2633_c0_g1_i1.p1 TRINITY_DN2633_c0_g1~~TRINITY_DN2633_c0_g1_i1.p1  ORF type:complete len:146 (-),score=76.55 TRINITY_DN2633_c0_g1_i1:46-450(-)
MPDIVTKDVAEPNDTEKDEDENEDEEEPQLDKDKKHNSGAADLEKVTDYAEDQEILSTGNELEDAIVAIRNKQAQKTAEKLARERELAKVVISKEHVELIIHEMELSKEKAERTLREHGGDVVKALTALVNAPA